MENAFDVFPNLHRFKELTNSQGMPKAAGWGTKASGRRRPPGRALAARLSMLEQALRENAFERSGIGLTRRDRVKTETWSAFGERECSERDLVIPFSCNIKMF
jgi:hypothetical protein